jgi:hypothetical protein
MEQLLVAGQQRSLANLLAFALLYTSEHLTKCEEDVLPRQNPFFANNSVNFMPSWWAQSAPCGHGLQSLVSFW